MFHVKQPSEAVLHEPEIVFRRICRKNGVSITPEQENALRVYVQLLSEWNAKINLVSRRDEGNIWFSQVLHSVSPLFFLDIPAGLRLLDLGSGGGFPGIPLAILCSDLHITLLDSIRKKTIALEDMIGRLGLSTVQIVNGRAEDVGRKKGFAGTYDIVVARAVAPLVDLAKWSRPLLKSAAVAVAAAGNHRDPARMPIPCLLAYKGGNLTDEIEEARIKQAQCSVTTIDLVFDGNQELGLEEKKLLIVRFS